MANKDYRAIEIISNNCTCKLSKHTGKRFLVDQFSELVEDAGFNPLCKCTFKRYADRRCEKDRRKFDISTIVFNAYRRTKPFGRRVKDELTKLRYEKMLSELHLVA